MTKTTMEWTRKMIVMPEDRLIDVLGSAPAANSKKTMSNDQDSTEGTSVQTPGDNLSRLDTQMYVILKSNKFADERDKCKNYLQGYLFCKEAERHEDREATGEVNEIQDAVTDETILMSVPKIYAQKARRLLKH